MSCWKTVRGWFYVQRIVKKEATRIEDLKPGEARLETAEKTVTVKEEGVFITPQSLASFPGAAAAVTVLHRVIVALVPSQANNLWIPLLCSLLVGAAVFGVSIWETWNTLTLPKRFQAIVIALVNTGMLFLTAAGVDSLTPSSSE